MSYTNKFHTPRRMLAICALVLIIGSLQRAAASEEILTTASETGTYGGRLTVSLRSEPKTLNPVTSLDISSREVISQMTADLIHIDRDSQQIVPALAKSWTVSHDGLRYTLQLRDGIRFSDGAPFDADDVVFSFKVYLDEKTNSPQRDLLTIGDKAIGVRKDGPYTVTFILSRPYASAERIFDSVAILPRHLLEKTYQEGRLDQAWALGSSPDQIAGLGPFRLKQYVFGQRLVLERNPYYWKADRQGNRLPYLAEMMFLFVPNEDTEVLRFEAGDTDVINRIGAANYGVLEREHDSRVRLFDLGPSLEYNFLLFNLNAIVPTQSKDLSHEQTWFRNVKFRQAVSAAIDRDAMARIIYHGRGTPLWTHVTPANHLWLDSNVARTPRSLSSARELLKAAGFSWRSDGTLIDSASVPVEFSIVASASNNQRVQMATMIQQDLQDIGMQVHVVSLEFRAVLDRVLQTHDYEAAVMGLGTGDTDPNAQMNVWLSNGDDHLWTLGAPQASASWEAEIDRLMKEQVSTLTFKDRKRLYDRVQEIEAENLPLICLVSPHVLVGANRRLENFKPVVLDPHTLWNADEMFFAEEKRAAKP
jgi:peptide/nickel transport system substrate-binding protein